MFTFRKVLNIMLIMVMTLIVSSAALAQDDEMMDDEMAVEEVKCRPDSLITPWDIKLAEDSTLKAKFSIHLSFANDFFNKKEYEKAKPHLWKAMVAASDQRYKMWALKKLISCYYEMGIKMKGEQAVAYLDSALIMSYRGLEINDDLTYNYWCGVIQNLLQRYSCAIPHYERLVQLKPDNKNYLQTLAKLYARNNDDKAIELQQKVVEMDPNDAHAREVLEMYVSALGGELLDVYKNSYEKDPNNAEYAWKYGNALLEVGEFIQAINVFRQYNKLKPEDVNVYAKLGSAYYGESNYKRAIANYKAYLAKKPNDLKALIRLGDIYREQGSYQTAVNYAYKALRAKPGYGEAYILIAMSYRDAAISCSGNRAKPGTTYDDKLVYKKAYDILSKALKDPEAASRAASLRKALKQAIPTKEDEFLYGGRKNIKDSCYSWIK